MYKSIYWDILNQLLDYKIDYKYCFETTGQLGSVQLDNQAEQLDMPARPL